MAFDASTSPAKSRIIIVFIIIIIYIIIIIIRVFFFSYLNPTSICLDVLAASFKDNSYLMWAPKSSICPRQHGSWSVFQLYDTIHLCLHNRSCSHAAWQKVRCEPHRTSSQRTAPSSSLRSDGTAWRGKSARTLSEEMQTHKASAMNSHHNLTDTALPQPHVLHLVLLSPMPTCLPASNMQVLWAN